MSSELTCTVPIRTFLVFADDFFDKGSQVADVLEEHQIRVSYQAESFNYLFLRQPLGFRQVGMEHGLVRSNASPVSPVVLFLLRKPRKSLNSTSGQYVAARA
jgi:hypothetical protein